MTRVPFKCPLVSILKQRFKTPTKENTTNNKMHHKSKVKKVYKSIFFVIQAIVFVASITISVISLTIFYRGKNILKIPLVYLGLSQLVCALSFTSSIVGFRTMHSKKKIKLFFYIVFTLALMNIQVMISLKSSLIPEKFYSWGDTLWDTLGEDQKEFVQNKFQCCGFSSLTDRPGGTCLYKSTTCFNVLHGMSLSVRSLIEKTMMFLFLTESTGIGIISLLKLRK